MSASYSATNIQVLKGLEAVRKRPGMYIGSTGPDGLHHLVYEVVDNSIDEAMAGHCDKIIVALEQNDIVRVEDNGRGIPTDIHPTEGISALELVLTRLHAGGKFDKGSYKVSGGLHGVGVSCVNALSNWLEATIYRDGKVFNQKYEVGVATAPVKEIGKIEEKTGTTIRWQADPTIFTETTTYNFDVLAKRLRELAFLNSGITIILRDERLSTPKETEFRFEGGIKSFVKYLDEGKTVIPEEPVYFEGEKNEVITEVALHYNTGYNENILSFVNDINTKEGGTHLEGFKTALTRVMNAFLQNNAKLQKKLDFFWKCDKIESNHKKFTFCKRRIKVKYTYELSVIMKDLLAGNKKAFQEFYLLTANDVYFHVKQIINKLEQKGFVSVEPDAADRRKLRISLTEYAAVTGEKYRLKEEEFMTGLFDGVTEEEAKQAFLILSKMEANLMKLRGGID